MTTRSDIVNAIASNRRSIDALDNRRIEHLKTIVLLAANPEIHTADSDAEVALYRACKAYADEVDYLDSHRAAIRELKIIALVNGWSVEVNHLEKESLT